MKKYILLLFIVSFLLNCATTQSKANMGYDLVLWGSSAAVAPKPDLPFFRQAYKVVRRRQPTTANNSVY